MLPFEFVTETDDFLSNLYTQARRVLTQFTDMHKFILFPKVARQANHIRLLFTLFFLFPDRQYLQGFASLY
ncbi:hypothetical protein D1614_23340 [Maribellus luteus]|uniref:Uncharacterized protein n=1 Tax=Maribellus luteus TaxID=2305463 RepID=A0A399SSC1_9BACT|nr:hypothetical protein D1614_23340 [Maribellus luteus]